MWKKLKVVGIGILVAGVIASGFMAWQQHLRVQEAKVEAARVGAERDAALEEVARVQAALDSAVVADSLANAERLAEKARVEARNAVLRQRADSLVGAIGALMPPELVDREIAEAVQGAVRDIQVAHEEEVANLDNLLQLSQETITRLYRQIDLHQEANEGLREALRLMEVEKDLWQTAAQPDIFGRLKSNAGLLGGVSAVTTIVTLIVAG
jgi:hypothetical protein